MLLRIAKSRRVIEAWDLRLVTSQIKDSENMVAQTTRLNGGLKPCFRTPSVKAMELRTTKPLYNRIGHPRSSGGLDFSNESSRVSNIFLNTNARRRELPVHVTSGQLS